MRTKQKKKLGHFKVVVVVVDVVTAFDLLFKNGERQKRRLMVIISTQSDLIHSQLVELLKQINFETFFHAKVMIIDLI